MPLPAELLEEMSAKRRDEEVAANRDRLLDYFWTAMICLAWSSFGVVSVLWSAHTTSMTYGRIAFFGGLGAGNAGIIFTLLGAYRRGEKRGDW